MTKKLPKRGLPPMHPGELLHDEILPALDRPKTEMAKLLGVSRQMLYNILEEKPVTTDYGIAALEAVLVAAETFSQLGQ